MDLRMELFLEKIFSRTHLDDAQHTELAQTIHDDYDRLTSEAEARGLSREQAEEEAFRQIESPDSVERYLHLHAGAPWAWFALGACIFSMMLTYLTGLALAGAIMQFSGSKPWEYQPFFTVLSLIIGVVVIFEVWQFLREMRSGIRIDDETVTIRRFSSQTVRFPIAKIRKAGFERGYLPGFRRVVLDLDDSEVVIPARMRGAYGLGLLLESLPNVETAASVVEFLRRKGRPNKERILLKIVSSAFWILGLVLFAMWIVPFWGGRGVPWGLLILVLVSPIAALIQMISTPNRARKGALLVVFQGAFLFFFVALLTMWLFGNLRIVRWLILWFPTSALLALWIQWTRTTRIRLAVVTFVCLGLMLPLYHFVPDSIGHKVKEIGSVGLEIPFVGMMSDGTMVWSHGRRDPASADASPTGDLVTFLTIVPPGSKPQDIRLGTGSWSIYRCYDPKDWYIFRQYSKTNGSVSQDISELYRWKGTNLERVPGFPTDAISFMPVYMDQPSGLPAGRLPVLQLREDGGVYVCSLFDTAKGTSISLGAVTGFRWIDEKHLEYWTASRLPPQLFDETTRTRLAGYELDTAAFTTRKLHEFVLSGDERPSLLPKSHYVLLSGASTTSAATMSLMDLTSGRRTSIPFVSPVDSTWNSVRKRLAYSPSTFYGKGGPSTIFVVEPGKGVVARKDFGEHEGIAGITISPDGTKVAYFRWAADSRFVLSGLARLEYWDTVTGRIEPLASLGLPSSLKVSLRDVTGLPGWSPDGKSIYYLGSDRHGLAIKQVFLKKARGHAGT